MKNPRTCAIQVRGYTVSAQRPVSSGDRLTGRRGVLERSTSRNNTGSPEYDILERATVRAMTCTSSCSSLTRSPRIATGVFSLAATKERITGYRLSASSARRPAEVPELTASRISEFGRTSVMVTASPRTKITGPRASSGSCAGLKVAPTVIRARTVTMKFRISPSSEKETRCPATEHLHHVHYHKCLQSDNY